MVKDRLAEMQAKRDNASSSKSRNDEASRKPLLNSEQQLEECLTRVSEIDNKIKNLKTDIEQMSTVQKHILSTPMVDKNKVKNLEKISDKIFDTCSEIQKEIGKYKSEVIGMHMDNIHDKMVKTHLDRLNSYVTKAMNDFRAAQVEYIEKMQKLHNKKVEIVTGGEVSGSDQPIDTSCTLFAEDYFSQSEKAKMELREVESRDMEIKKLESSIVEVNRLFKEVNALVMEQGETLDIITENVVQTEVKIVEASGNLRTAEQHMSSARRKKLCCWGIIVAIVIIVAVVITIIFVSQK